MYKPAFKLCFMMIFLSLVSAVLFAGGDSEDNDVLRIQKALYAPEIDGDLDDIWLNTENIPAAGNVKGTGPSVWTDSFAFFRALWDEHNIYLYITVYDDKLDTHHPDDWQKDSLELFFDGDNSKNSLTKGYDSNDVHFRWIYGQNKANQGPGSLEGVFKKKDYGFDFETAIPITALKFSLKEGRKIGFDLQYNDNDGGERQHIVKWWSESDDNWRAPSEFGTAELSRQTASELLEMNIADFSPKIDGEPDEGWADYPLVSCSRYIFFTSKGFDSLDDWNDSVLNYRTAWDRRYFYLFAEILDDEINTNAEEGWENDSIEIFFDGDNGKNGAYDKNDIQWRWIYGKTFAEPGPEGELHKWKKTAYGYNFELRIPLKSLPFNLAAGYEIGFEIQLNDNDFGKRQNAVKWYSDIDESWKNTKLFGTAVLSDPDFRQNMYVQITYPESSSEIYSDTAVIISADVKVEEGSVNRVDFYIDDKKMETDKSVPYEFEWTGFSEGQHKIYVLASHVSGSVTRSKQMVITVSENPDIEKSDKPVFSHEHGFYSDPFVLEISSGQENALIKYTLDGSDPRSSSNAFTAEQSAKIDIDPENDEGSRGKNPGFIVRACVRAEGFGTSKTVTATYMFAGRVADLSPENTAPGPGWPKPTRSGQWMDYGMDPQILNDSRYKDLIEKAMTDIPTLSLVTDLDNLFDSDTGIYMNANMHGADWERPASLELINPDGTEGFQVNAGVRIRGGWSRHPDNPKHAFRMFFRKEYGDAKLEYPLFGEEGADEFDKIDIRTSQNYSWSYANSPDNTMNRDVFSRDLQGLTGQPYTRSRYYHLFINGVYWGLFQTQERADSRFASTYMGGDKDDYDALKPNINDDYGSTGIEATDGNLETWKELWEITKKGFKSNEDYFRVQGRNADGSENSDYPVLVDVENLIDYMLIIFYAGNFDAPVNVWSSNKGIRNFFTVYNRNDNEGFQFILHDAEHTLNTMKGIGPGTVGLEENRVNIGFRTGSMKMVIYDYSQFNPQWLQFRLSENEEFKMLMADRIYRYFFNNGIMTPEKAAELFKSRAEEIEFAIIAESARWGDAKSGRPYNRDDHWTKAVNDIIENYFPYRTEIVINQLKEVGWYPDTEPPLFTRNGVELKDEKTDGSGFMINIKNPNNSGTVYYTTDGTDPRMTGGAVSPEAVNGGSGKEIKIGGTVLLKARIKNGNEWSALHSILFSEETGKSSIKITELHYHPLDYESQGEKINDDKLEFIELKNTGSRAVDLSGCSFTDNSINYVFEYGTIIEPGEIIILVSDAEAFGKRYSVEPFDEYSGQLANSGETITLADASGKAVFTFEYDDKMPWPEGADGAGYSLESKSPVPKGNPGDISYWKLSEELHGNPGE